MTKIGWPKAFLVDLDNTLHDYRTASQIARWALAARIEKLHGVPKEAVLARYEVLMGEEKGAVAASARKMRVARITKLLAGWPSTRAAAPEGLAMLLEDALLDAVRPFDGALAAFCELQARARTMVVTEGYGDMQQATASRLGLSLEPGDLLATYVHGVRKVDGGAYRLARDRLDIDAHDIVMVGDNWPWDILASATAGMYQVWVQGNQPVCGRPPPRHLGSVRSFREVPSFIADCVPVASPPLRRAGGSWREPESIISSDASRRRPPEDTAACDGVELPLLPADWFRYAMTDHAQSIVISLKEAIEAEAVRTTAESILHKEYGVSCVMIGGSTCRGTSAALPVDFDLAVLTEREQKFIPHDVLHAACNELVTNISSMPPFARYCESVAALSGVVPDGAKIELESLGLRGTASLVARYLLVMNGAEQTFRCGFLDVTCGRLPHLLGYEGWMSDHFDQLGPGWAGRLRTEIRLAKAVLAQVEGVYGSKGRGLRGHAVEQLVIQSRNYRPAGLPIGTFDNAMRLIVEEGGRRRFCEFKLAFPLWRPGGHDHNGQPVNLWHLLGDGEPRAAEDRWLKLIILATAYQRYASNNHAWSIKELADFVRDSH